jgi:superfamily II DNA/RNA helicase
VIGSILRVDPKIEKT